MKTTKKQYKDSCQCKATSVSLKKRNAYKLNTENFNFLQVQPKIIDARRKSLSSVSVSKKLQQNKLFLALESSWTKPDKCVQIQVKCDKVLEEIFSMDAIEVALKSIFNTGHFGQMCIKSRHVRSEEKLTGDQLEIVGDDNENTISITGRHVNYLQYQRPKSYFYIAGQNGTALVAEFFTTLGWKRTSEKWQKNCKLRWCETKNLDYYRCFREGEQLCYQIPNNALLTTKIGLLHSLKEYQKTMEKNIRTRCLNYHDFLPETYRLDINEDRRRFFKAFTENEVWICKPTGLSQGRGIYLIRSFEDFNAMEYISRPLLLNGRKFDVRNYILIACTKPVVAFYGDGYCRLTCVPYDLESSDLTGHLTNQSMQKKNPLYSEVKEDTVWSMDQFNDYVNQHYVNECGIDQDWVHLVLKRRCKEIMLHCLKSVNHKLESRLGYFDLYGCDFIIDENFKVKLLEMNCNPSLNMNCAILKEIMPELVYETLTLAMEIFVKVRRGECIRPLKSQRKFVLLYDGDVHDCVTEPELMTSIKSSRSSEQVCGTKKCKTRLRRCTTASAGDNKATLSL